MMKKITLLTIILSATFGFAQVPTIDFETNGADYISAAGAGTSVSIITDNSTNGTQVAELTNAGDTYENYPINLDYQVSFSDPSKRVISLDFYNSTNTSHLVWVKFEGSGVPPVLVARSSDATAGWETLTFDFGNNAIQQDGCYCSPVVPTGSYNLMYIFIDGGATTSSVTRIDNAAGGTQGAAIIPPITSLNVDFETATLFASYDGAVYTDMVTNDVTDGINSSSKSGQIAQVNQSLYANTQYPVSQGMDLSTGDKGFSLMVKGPRAVPVLFKLEGGANQERSLNYTTPGVWQKLTYDFSFDTSTNHNKIVIFFDITGAPSGSSSDDIFLIDNLEFDTLTSLSTNDIELTEFKVFPNPTLDTWNLKTNNIKITSIQVYDILGKSVLTLTPNNTIAKIDATTLSKGLYFAKVSSESGSSSLKLIKN